MDNTSSGTVARRHRTSVASLQQRAEASAAMAAADKAAAKFAAEAELAQAIVEKTADALQLRADNADRYDAERTAISSRLDVAVRTSFDLQDRIAKCREMLDDSLRAGRTEDASAHGTALGSMALTAQRCAAIVEALRNEWQSVPTSDLTPEERASIPTLRAIAASPTRAHAHVVQPMTMDRAEEYRRLGRRVAQDEAEGRYWRNVPTPMQVRR